MSCCLTLDTRCYIPQSFAVKRSVITSTGAVSLVANDTRGKPLSSESSSPPPSVNVLCSLKTLNLFKLLYKLLHIIKSAICVWCKTIRTGQSGDSSFSKLNSLLVSCEMCDLSDHVIYNLSLAWSSFLVMPMMPFCILQVLFPHSVAWSAET